MYSLSVQEAVVSRNMRPELNSYFIQIGDARLIAMDDLVASSMKVLARLRQAKSEQDRILRKMGASEMSPRLRRRAARRSPRKSA